MADVIVLLQSQESGTAVRRFCVPAAKPGPKEEQITRKAVDAPDQVRMRIDQLDGFDFQEQRQLEKRLAGWQE